jgi:hypothetical protein
MDRFVVINMEDIGIGASGAKENIYSGTTPEHNYQRSASGVVAKDAKKRKLSLIEEFVLEQKKNKRVRYVPPLADRDTIREMREAPPSPPKLVRQNAWCMSSH